MNLFLFDDDTVPLPPVITNQSFQRVTAVFDTLSRSGGGSAPGITVRAREDVLVDAKAVDERVRAGQNPPLAGTLVVAPPSAPLCRRLARAGAVVLGTTEPGREPEVPPGDADRPGDGGYGRRLTRMDPWNGADAVIVSGTPGVRGPDAVVFVPTRGLVPHAGTVSVLAGDVAVGQRIASALTGPDADAPGCRDWPDWAPLSAGEHPRVAALEGDPPEPETRRHFGDTIASLRAAGALVEPIDTAPGTRHGGGHPAAVALRDHDALLVPWTTRATGLPPLVGELDATAVALPDAGGRGIALVAQAFDDQVVLDLAGLLTGAQASQPYPTVGVGLIAFGAFLRGQPRQAELDRVRARFAGQVTTAARYRMLALGGDPPEAGVVTEAAPDGTGVGLVAERWLLSPAGLAEFATHLRPPMRLGGVELADGSRDLGVLCEPDVAARGTDVTAWGCWRAYLRHLSTQRPSVRYPDACVQGSAR
ncbi:allophanate hydrolase-related protein [Saccharomonospora saliphila]|uniref:allophanate hydrolase-related protein n=1 Tax=Saccharomonospora saliphila TaxID=369829 RepID=UPI00035D8D10|nr:hypothetical protein [Saccharomonospora saliphila]